MTQAKQILMKHLSSGHEEIEVSFHPTDIELIIAAMQEYAALTSPASGWVKCSERAVVSTPGKKVIIKYKGVPDLLINHRGTLCWYQEERVCNYEYPVDNDSWSAIEWLDENIISAETPLPTVEDPVKAMKKLVWDMIEEWQMSRDKDEDINEDKFSYQDIEVDLYGWLEKIDKQFPALKHN